MVQQAHIFNLIYSSRCYPLVSLEVWNDCHVCLRCLVHDRTVHFHRLFFEFIGIVHLSIVLKWCVIWQNTGHGFQNSDLQLTVHSYASAYYNLVFNCIRVLIVYGSVEVGWHYIIFIIIGFFEEDIKFHTFIRPDGIYLEIRIYCT